ncbi:Carboxyl transferase domain protein, partial [mine drainage metagenome]
SEAPPGEQETLRRRLVEDYRAEYLHPYLAAERGYLDAVVDPASTRDQLGEALTTLLPKRADRPARKHGNIPL